MVGLVDNRDVCQLARVADGCEGYPSQDIKLNAPRQAVVGLLGVHSRR